MAADGDVAPQAAAALPPPPSPPPASSAGDDGEAPPVTDVEWLDPTSHPDFDKAHGPRHHKLGPQVPPVDDPSVTSRAPPRHVYVVGITGCTRSGKTTLTRALKSRLGAVLGLEGEEAQGEGKGAGRGRGPTRHHGGGRRRERGSGHSGGGGGGGGAASSGSSALPAELAPVQSIHQDKVFRLDWINGPLKGNWDTPDALDHDAMLERVEGVIERAKRTGKPDVLVLEGFMLLHDPRLAALIHTPILVDVSEATVKERRFRSKFVSESYWRRCIWPNHTSYLARVHRDYPPDHVHTISSEKPPPKRATDAAIKIIKTEYEAFLERRDGAATDDDAAGAAEAVSTKGGADASNATTSNEDVSATSDAAAGAGTSGDAEP